MSAASFDHQHVVLDGNRRLVPALDREAFNRVAHQSCTIIAQRALVAPGSARRANQCAQFHQGLIEIAGRVESPGRRAAPRRRHQLVGERPQVVATRRCVNGLLD